MKKDKLTKAGTREITELESEIVKLKKQLAASRLEIKAGKTNNTSLVKNLKKDLAQLLTILTIRKYQEKQEDKMEKPKVQHST